MDSFDEFIQVSFQIVAFSKVFFLNFVILQMSVQSIVAESPAIDLQAEAQHTSGEIETPVSIIEKQLPKDPNYFKLLF